MTVARLNRGNPIGDFFTLAKDFAFRTMIAADAAAVVALNATVVAVTSPMDAARHAELLALSAFAEVAEHDGEIVGFILPMAEGTAYNNGNFAWFSERLRRFVYIDRVVVAAATRGQGLGEAFYRRLSIRARDHGALWLAAEIDSDPPNPGSLAFHRRNGFVAVGERRLDSGKAVSMQALGL